MVHLRWGIVVAVALILMPTLATADDLAPGRYELLTVDNALQRSVMCIVQLEKKDKGWAATLVAGHPRIPNQKVESLAVDGKVLTLVLSGPTGKLTYIGTIADDPKSIKGNFGDERRVQMAMLEPTERETLGTSDIARPLTAPPPMREAMTLSTRPAQLRFQASRETDAEKKAELTNQANEADKAAREKVPALYREVLEKYGSEVAATFAALGLLSSAARNEASPQEVRQWLEQLAKLSKPYGARWEIEQKLRVAEMLQAAPNYQPIALDLARELDLSLGASASLERQSRVLTLLHNIETKTGAASATATKTRLDRVEGLLDKEYLAKVPPFKPTPFAGRKGNSSRVVVMELFTGAQCPPCVAADVAFDALLKAYQPKDVVFLQYHMHIPGPDPLTNADSEARFQYYRKKYPNDIRGTPSTLFNGKPAAGGGGSMANAESKYQQYGNVISPLLEQEAVAQLDLTARLQGAAQHGKVTVSAKVTGLKEKKESLRLRFVLVEDTVRYVGGNALRFHHHVVRGFPGGVAGLPVSGDGQTIEATQDLDELRKTLSKYLDDYASRRPFPKADRPIDLSRLRVIAFLQDDESQEILAAQQVDLDQTAASK